MNAAALLIIGVEPTYREPLRELARLHELEPLHFSDDAWTADAHGVPSLCVVGVSGGCAADFERVPRLKARYPATPLVVLAREASIDEVVAMMRLGAADVIALPQPAEVVAERSFAPISVTTDGQTEPEFDGHGPAIRVLRQALALAAASPATLLITGETGSGKGVAARAAHARSHRRELPFVHLDCAALSASLIESELFGHERGAFTGAEARRVGRFELAASGTIFLDEIGELAPPLQAKLLRVLEERRFERVGGTRALRMQARVIAATNIDIEHAVRERRFREDLYYRLNVLRIEVPALRDRSEDIPALVLRGLRQQALQLGFPPPKPSAALLERLTAEPWPGNVRQLMNVLERLLVKHPGGWLDAPALDEILAGEAMSRGNAPDRCCEHHDGRAEPEIIAEVLASTGGNVSRAARRLELARSTLRHKIKKYGLGRLIPSD